MSKKSQNSSKWQQWLAGHHIRNHRHLQFLGNRLHDRNLWRFNRYSTSMGAAVGLFMCLMPIPFQMVAGAIVGFFIRANLALSIGLVWISNPITMIPILWVCYKIGRYFLQSPPLAFNQFTWDHITENFHHLWQPMLLGCLIAGLVCSSVAFTLIQVTWRFIQHHFPQQDDDAQTTL